METWSWRGRPIVKMVSTGVSTIGAPPTVDTGRSVDAVQDNNVGQTKVEAKANEETDRQEGDTQQEAEDLAIETQGAGWQCCQRRRRQGTVSPGVPRAPDSTERSGEAVT